MINTENINQLIETIEKAPAEHMIMGNYDWILHCGTAHCIGGWAMVLGAPEDLNGRAEWYGLDIDAAGNMELMRNDYDISIDDFDTLPAEDRKDLALNVLRHLVKTGHVDWNSELLTTDLAEEHDDGY